MDIDRLRIYDASQMTDSDNCLLQVIGVGGCGGNTVDAIHKKDIKNISVAVCDFDAFALQRLDVDTKILLKKYIPEKSDKNDDFGPDSSSLSDKKSDIIHFPSSHELNISDNLKADDDFGPGHSTLSGENCEFVNFSSFLDGERSDSIDANDDFELDDTSIEEISSLFNNDSKYVVLIAGLGGKTSNKVAPLMAKAAKEAGKTTFAIVTTPFMFEGIDKTEKAYNVAEEIRKEVDKIYVLKNESIMESRFSIVGAFAAIDGIVVKLINSIISNPKSDTSNNADIE